MPRGGKKYSNTSKPKVAKTIKTMKPKKGKKR